MALKNVVIEKIDISSFGGVSGKSLSFDRGINLITAHNECGKSTVLAAIMFALYGFYSQSRSIGDNPKKKYMPWSGAAASVALTLGGSKRLRIERTVSGNKENAVCTELTTGLPLYAGKVFGEEILGIGADTAEKILFFSTAEPHQSKDEPLVASLQNLLFSADEQISGEKAVKVITSHKNALKGRTGGLIPKLETEEIRLSEKIDVQKHSNAERNRLETETEQIKDAIAHRETETALAEKERENLQKYQASLLLEEYARLTARDRDATAALDAFGNSNLTIEYVNGCRSLKEELSTARAHGDRIREELAELSAEDGEDEAITEVAARCKKNKTTATLSGVVFAVLAVLAVVCFVLKLTVPAIALGVVGLALGVFALGLAMACKNTVNEAGCSSVAELCKAAAEIPERCAQKRARLASLESELKKQNERCAELEGQIKEMGFHGDTDAMYAALVELEKLRAEKKNTLSVLEDFKIKQNPEALKARAEGAVKPTKSAEQIETEYRFATQSARMLREKLSPLLARLEALKMADADASETEEELSRTRTKLEEARLDYDALVMASECLTESGVEMKSSVSPRISEKAGDYFAAATEGRYKGVELDTRLYMSVDGENGVKSAEHLSTGARDMAYLCMRLGLVDLIYGDGCVPLIMDDAFCRQDDDRQKALLKVLGNTRHQVIVTGCTDREMLALEAMGIDYKGIRL